VKKLVTFFLILLFLCSCSNINQSLEQLKAIDDKMVDAYNLAGATARINLSPVVSKMQDIKNELDNLQVSQCLNYAKSDYDKAFTDIINAYLAFMRQGDYQSLLDNGKTEWDLARNQVNVSCK